MAQDDRDGDGELTEPQVDVGAADSCNVHAYKSFAGGESRRNGIFAERERLLERFQHGSFSKGRQLPSLA
jgi:hypothetical protein